MVSNQVIEECLKTIERQIREAAADIDAAVTPSMRKRATRQHNALNAAANDLWRFTRI